MSLADTFADKIKSISNLPDLKKKIYFTLLMFLVARIGTHIPAPGIDTARLGDLIKGNNILGFLNMFSGGAFTKISIFALGVMPYINASIIFQLLAVIIPKLEEIQKEGDSGRQKITQWTRYLTIVIGALQGFGVCVWLKSAGLVQEPGILFMIRTMTILTAGTVFLMWVGEQISLKGIGNGVSLIIFINIMARMPGSIIQTLEKLQSQPVQYFLFFGALLLILIVAITGAVVTFQLGQRKIPIQYVGKGIKQNSVASNTYLPLKLNMSGVMPIIFASVLMTLPSMMIGLLPTSEVKTILTKVLAPTHPLYLVLYAVLVIFFAFFYTAMTFDPEKVAENLKKSGGAIPGIRPGSETVDYLENVVTKITWGGAIFLGLIAILPNAIFSTLGVSMALGGTGILIVVGVALDTVQQINANLVMRDYEGFMS